ncbi:hypothetical protein [Erwinia sp. ErVv1]|uniref:hypothetical protein n=1 Tax=Erwinia sp. ErVv1 TaxID=1603299 RepID=UPI0012E7F0E3|nr:hypothetical protein [Erwinia sp. ErVv1]
MCFPSGMNYKWEFCEREQSFDVALTGDLALNSDTIMIEAASAGLAFVLKGLVQWLREWVL